MAICPRKYQHPRSGGCSGWSGYGGCSGRGRPGCVAPKQQLQYTIYSSTAVQQYNRDSSTAAFHTTHAERWSADYIQAHHPGYEIRPMCTEVSVRVYVCVCVSLCVWVRVWCTDPVREPGERVRLRVRLACPVSMSGLHVRFTCPVSMSGLRVRLACPVYMSG